ncbi:MAG: DUF983 domain-containing protein [Alphaproteobacteria bacterium]|nr:DUF983 domain-containing protein [Alphaproteobacteria bacterium]
MTRQIGILDGLKRGLALRCPTCGEGRLFASYLKPTAHCAVCGADNTIYPSDDAPPYLTALLIGHLFVPLLLAIDHAYDSPLWLTLSIALPLFAVLTLAALPFVKGAVIGYAHATGVTRASIGSATL